MSDSDEQYSNRIYFSCSLTQSEAVSVAANRENRSSKVLSSITLFWLLGNTQFDNI